jgi:hypothetical protein
MNVIDVITDPDEVKKILRHLVKDGPGGAPLRRAADPHPGWNRAPRNGQSVSLPAPGDEHVPAAPPVSFQRRVS